MAVLPHDAQLNSEVLLAPRGYRGVGVESGGPPLTLSCLSRARARKSVMVFPSESRQANFTWCHSPPTSGSFPCIFGPSLLPTELGMRQAAANYFAGRNPSHNFVKARSYQPTRTYAHQPASSPAEHSVHEFNRSLPAELEEAPALADYHRGN